MIRLKMNGLTNAYDETVVYFQAGATTGFDGNYDAYFLSGPNPAPHISQEYNSVLMAINGVAPVSQTFSINILVTTPTSGSFTISAADFEELPAGTCVYLKDLNTGNSTNVLTSSYAFVLQNTTNAPRFVLIITNYSLAFTSSLIQPNCAPGSTGSYKLQGTGNGPWNYTWKDSAGSILKTSVNLFGSDSLSNLAAGNYSVQIISNDGCYSGNANFTIQKPLLSAVPFTSDLSQPGCKSVNGGRYKIKATSAGAWNYTWKSATESIRSTLNTMGGDSLFNLSNGTYTVEITSSDACRSNTTSFSIQEVILPVVAFTGPDTIVVGEQNFKPINRSTGCAGYAWSFGDVIGSSPNFEPSHKYTLPGVYKVNLRGFNNVGCVDTAHKYVTVVDRATQIKTELNRSASFAELGNNLFKINLNQDLTDEYQVNLFNLSGVNVHQQNKSGFDGAIDLDLSSFRSDIYILNITSKNTLVLSRKLVVK